MNYLKFNWQKNFFNIPHDIKQKLSTIESNDLVVSCVKKIHKDSILNGDYNHMGICFKNNKLIVPSSVLPEENVGRYSTYNRNGREIKLRKLPKVSRSYSADSPNFGDWSKGSHTVTWDRKVYQRKYWLPQGINITMSLLEENTDIFIIKFSLDTLISKTAIDFEETLLYHFNLLQENCGACNIFDADASNAEYIKTLVVEWELLPPGESNFNNNLNYITDKTNNNSPNFKNELQDRMTFFESLSIRKYIIGVNSFNRYFGAILNNNLVILENVRYGNAIYIFYEDWDKLSKLSRIELLNSNSSKFTRITHTKKWKYKVEKTVS